MNFSQKYLPPYTWIWFGRNKYTLFHWLYLKIYTIYSCSQLSSIVSLLPLWQQQQQREYCQSSHSAVNSAQTFNLCASVRRRRKGHIVTAVPAILCRFTRPRRGQVNIFLEKMGIKWDAFFNGFSLVEYFGREFSSYENAPEIRCELPILIVN